MTVAGPRLAAMLARHGLELRRLTPIAGDGHAAVFRLDLAGSIRAKLRVYPTREAAARVDACLRSCPPGLLPGPLAREGRRLVVEFVDGVTLDRRLAGAARQQTARFVAAAGRLLARLHGCSRPAVPFSSIDVYARLIEGALRAVVRRHLLDADVAATLIGADRPRHMPVAITHGDLCPENLVVDRRGRLRAIDEERVAVRAIGYDLARVICRWPLEADLERIVLRAYRASGGEPGAFEESRTFWMASALSTSAGHRLRHRPNTLGPVLRALRRLADRSR